MKIFGYPKYNKKGEMVLTTYTNDYKHMNMDIRLYSLKKGEVKKFKKPTEEMAILLLSGKLNYAWKGGNKTVSRKCVFCEGPWALHVSKNELVTLKAITKTEILVQCTKNNNKFKAKLYSPKDAPFKYSCVGKFGNTAKRRVNTIIDYDINPKSHMVLGEILNDRGNWSGYLPHRHPQPECYFFKFDHPEGFGASFIDDKVFKSVNNSFSAIPGGALHPQVCAPGYQMYTCWMIRHFDKKPWLQTDRNEDKKFIWLHNAKF